MSWLHVIVRDGRVIGGEHPPVVAEAWKRVPRSPMVRSFAAGVLATMGYEVGNRSDPRLWAKFPKEANAFLCMTKGGGRAGSSIETFAVREVSTPGSGGTVKP